QPGPPQTATTGPPPIPSPPEAGNAASEPRAEAEQEAVDLVEILLHQRLRKVEPDRTERRTPCHAYAHGHAQCVAVLNARIFVIVAAVRAHVSKYAPLQPQFRRQSEWERQFRGCSAVAIAAQSVVRLPVTRTDAADRKATERLATLEEPVVEPDVLAEAEDVTGTPAYPEHHFVQHRVVPGGTNLSAEIVHGSTKTRDLVRQR